MAQCIKALVMQAGDLSPVSGTHVKVATEKEPTPHMFFYPPHVDITHTRHIPVIINKQFNENIKMYKALVYYSTAGTP